MMSPVCRGEWLYFAKKIKDASLKNCRWLILTGWILINQKDGRSKKRSNLKLMRADK